MATGRYLDDAALSAILLSALDGTNDLFPVWDDSAGEIKRVVASQILNRLTSTADISHLSALANLAAVDSANDKFLVWDADATAFKTLLATELMDRLLTTLDISALSALANLAAVDTASDKLLVWDASAGAFKTLTVSEISSRLVDGGTTAHTSSPVALTSANTNYINTNVGSTVAIEFDLPAATVGLIMQFARVENYSVRLDPNGSEIIGSGAAGKYLELQTAGFVKLRCFKAGAWTVVSETGITDWEA